VAERVIVRAEEVDIEFECFYKFIAEMRVKTFGYFLGYLVDDDEGSIEQADDVLVFLLIVVLLDLEAHVVIEGDHLIGEIVEEVERTLQGLHLHRVFVVHFGLEPSHELLHWDVQHALSN
jgi:hypothetical protein